MIEKFTIVLILIICFFNSYLGYAQMRKIYSNIESKNVLYFKVEEIVNMAFGGTTTRYTVSDLSLISKVDLGPDNIRIISPVYKEENYRKKYYIETNNSDVANSKDREPTRLLEIAIESGKIEIPENPSIEQSSLALVLSKLIKVEIPPAEKNATPVVQNTVAPVLAESQKEKRDFILVNVVYVYERVLEKGYQSAFMFREVANYYYFKGQMEKAAKWYEPLFAMPNEHLEPIYYFRFGDALRKTGKTQRGNELVEKFNRLVE
ncbi:hypothetical protein [Flavobacterium flavipallidum]|uniref:Tetratricopeptide repeat protein n=1 Tax=Flavobacterium flavipallidum TaxID=3139140 RepID=A0ABU9HS91_9FLAO